MEKTRNYQLNQWAAGDKVQRVDFNADNAKIDAAIKANADAIAAEVSARTAAVKAESSARTAAVQAARDACPLVLLRSVTLTQDAVNYSLDLTGFDWSLYCEVAIYLRLKNFSGKVLLNGKSGMEHYRDANYGLKEQFWEIGGGDPYVAACKLANCNAGFHAVWLDHTYWATPRYMYSTEESAPRRQFRTMDFIGTMWAGSRLTILGTRG